MKSLILAAGVSLFQLEPAGIMPFHICGEDDRKYTTEYKDEFAVSKEWVLKHGKAVGIYGGCSGTLISDKYFISAAHCGQSAKYVTFDYLKKGGEEDRYKIKAYVEVRNGGIDYQIMELEGEPSRKYHVQELTLKIPDLNEEIYILGHPERRKMMVSAGPMKVRDPRMIGYTADTKGGNSGSGVLDKEGRIFGVHAWGSCLDGSRWRGYNGGASIKTISEVSPIVKRLVDEATGCEGL